MSDYEMPQRYKQLKWFKEGQPIPVEATYTGKSRRAVAGDPGAPVQIDLGYTEHLYEVPYVKQDKPQPPEERG